MDIEKEIKALNVLNKAKLQEKCTELGIEFSDETKKDLTAKIVAKLKERDGSAGSSDSAGSGASSGSGMPTETRGRKPKELTTQDLRDDAKALVVKIRETVKQKKAAGKNGLRLERAASDIERLTRSHLID